MDAQEKLEHKRELQREAQRRYRAAHPDRVRENDKRNRADHPEIYRAIMSLWRASHPDKVSAKNKKYREAHPVETYERKKKYRLDYPDRASAACKKYHVLHPDREAALGKKTYPRRRSFILQRLYGIDLLRYKEMLISQNYVCLICGRPNRNGTSLSVDHDHKTGKVRGLLCFKCNAGLGSFCDDKDMLLSAIKYLERNTQ